MPHIDSPTLATALNGFVTTRTTVVPGKLATPAPGEFVLLATWTESLTAWKGAATREDAAAYGTQTGEVITVKSFRMVLFSSLSDIIASGFTKAYFSNCSLLLKRKSFNKITFFKLQLIKLEKKTQNGPDLDNDFPR